MIPGKGFLCSVLCASGGSLCAPAVLPDFERWPDNYVHISFDNSPTADNPRLAKLDAAQRRELAGAPQVAGREVSRMHS